MSKKSITIAIDGPAGSGKSTIAKLLAKKLDILFFSTGSIYRALGYKCKKLKLNPKSEVDAEKILDSDIVVKYVDGKQIILLDGENVTNKLSTNKVMEYASLISQHKKIREKCVKLQRQIASEQSLVMDGRDIGSVVLPNADYKFYLDANIDERAKRRFNELKKDNPNITLDDVKQSLENRDYNDTHRKISPLKLCDDAIKIDSSFMTIDEVVNEFIKIINKQGE